MYEPEHSPTQPLLTRTLHSHESDPEPFSRPAPRNDPAVGSSLPPSFVERGEVTSGEEMTTHYTDAEWADIIRKTAQEVGAVDDEQQTYAWDGDVVGRIDHTLLKLDAREEEFDRLCAEATAEGFASVCVRPDRVPRCVARLTSTPHIPVASVIGFHQGTADLSAKIQEVRASLTSGARELDVVLNWPRLQARSYAAVYHELATIRTQAPPPVLLKLILETSRLSRDEVVAGCVLAAAARFDFVKTSTGFCGRGATVGDVRLMRRCCERLREGDEGRVTMQVKASGGIRTLADAVAMLDAGASRLGASAGVAIARERRGKEIERGESVDGSAY